MNTVKAIYGLHIKGGLGEDVNGVSITLWPCCLQRTPRVEVELETRSFHEPDVELGRPLVESWPLYMTRWQLHHGTHMQRK